MVANFKMLSNSWWKLKNSYNDRQVMRIDLLLIKFLISFVSNLEVSFLFKKKMLG